MDYLLHIWDTVLGVHNDANSVVCIDAAVLKSCGFVNPVRLNVSNEFLEHGLEGFMVDFGAPIETHGDLLRVSKANNLLTLSRYFQASLDLVKGGNGL